MTQHKNLQLETLRGLIILTVVIAHVIGTTPEGGMKISNPSSWLYYILLNNYLLMPLFTAIAGWVYALKPVKVGVSINFITKKAYRLLIPMIVSATLYFVIQQIVPGTNQKEGIASIWKLFIFPYTFYWYLPSLFIIFIVIYILDYHSYMRHFKGWIICLIGAYICLIVQKNIIENNIPNYFSFMGAIILLPYFLIGVGLNRFHDFFHTRKIKAICFILGALGIMSLKLEWDYNLSENAIYKALIPISVISLVILLFNQKYTNRFFIWIGSFAYTIYLYHGFGTAGGRIIMEKLNINSIPIVLIFSTVFAISISIFVEKVAHKWRITRFLVFGKLN